MNAAVLATQDLPTVIGAPFGGGFFFGRILVDRNPHAIIVAPKAGGDHDDVRWSKTLKRVDGAISYYDSFANTVALAGSAVAKWAREQRIGGFDDWCIPARDVLEIIYRLGKPTDTKNYCYFRSGENPSSIPVGYPYATKLPAQTQIEAFREGGTEALDPAWYWSSTQSEGGAAYAWAQCFGGGTQGTYLKDLDCRVRLVRTIPI